jgi:hypothetical protein
VGLERGSLSLVSINEKLLERKGSGSGLENREYDRGDRLSDIPLSAKVGTNFADKRWSVYFVRRLRLRSLFIVLTQTVT